MTPDYQVLLIAVVFALQIVVLSFYAPLSWRHYRVLLFQRYPREQYPRLHPLAREELDRKFALFTPLHLVIGIGAALTLLGALLYGANPHRLAGLMELCLLLQLLPLYVALPLQVRITRAFRDLPPPSPRSVELRKWRITDFISPFWVALGFAGQALALTSAVVVYLYRPNTLGIVPTFIFSSAMLLVMGAAVFGYVALTARTDPYMSPTDTFRVRQRICRYLFGGGAAFGAWKTFVLLHNLGLFGFDVAYLFVGFSVIAQLGGFALVSRENSDLRLRDFSVYRADSRA